MVVRGTFNYLIMGNTTYPQSQLQSLLLHAAHSRIILFWQEEIGKVHATYWEDLEELEWWNVTATKHASTGLEEGGSQAMNI